MMVMMMLMITMIMNDWAAEHWLAREPAELTCSLRRSSSPARPRPPEPTSCLFLIFLIKYLLRISHYKTLSLSSPAPQFEPNNRPYLTFLITSFSYSLTSFSFPHPTPIFNSHSHMSHPSFSKHFFSFSLVFVSDKAFSSFWAAKGEPYADMIFVQNITQPDFQAKSFKNFGYFDPSAQFATYFSQINSLNEI